jgi:hypothetical protein
LEQAILIYLSRLAAVLWGLKIRTIERFVYQFIGDVCSKIVELLDELETELLGQSTPYHFVELRGLCKVMVEYNTMLNIVSSPPNLQYGEGLGSRKEVFEEALFFSVQK